MDKDNATYATYVPAPLDTRHIVLSAEIKDLTELLARNTHEVWSQQRVSDGWSWGVRRDDAQKHHPCLIPYEDLPESEKEYDRHTALETLKIIIALGYQFEKTERSAAESDAA